jgi:hypothetical protein
MLAAALGLAPAAAAQDQPAAAAGQGAYTITYRLNKPGQVSVAVYGADGRLVRTLAAAEPQPAGARSLNWDGNDDDGDPVADPASCTWKLLRTDGLKAKYLMTIGPTFPLGKEWWEHGPGEHNGPRSVAVDETGVYVAAGIVENARNAIKMDPTGTTCLWSAGAADAWQGRYSMSVMRNTVLFLAQNGQLYAHPAPPGHQGQGRVQLGREVPRRQGRENLPVAPRPADDRHGRPRRG